MTAIAANMNKPVGVILADDLTGACDSAVGVLNDDRRVAVTLDSDFSSFNGYRYVAVNSNTRSITEEESRKVVRDTAERIYELGGEIVYKKIDSTLRGNIRAELEELYDLLDIDLILIAPGYPQNGRIVKEGILFAGTGENRMSSSIREELGITEKTAVITSALVKEDREKLERFLLDAKENGIRYLIGDSEDCKDLKGLAEMVRNSTLKILPAGSGALVRYLIGGEYDGISGDLDAFTEGTVYVMGSAHPVTVRQVSRFLEEGAYGYAIDEEGYFPEERPLIVSTKQVLEGREVKRSIVGDNVSDTMIEKKIAKKAGELYRAGTRRMVLTGGDTAYGVLKYIGFNEIEILGETEPGVVCGIARSDRREPMLIVTKSGGFGNPETLLRIEQVLSGNKGD